MAGIPQAAGRERTIATGGVEIAVTEFPNPGRPPVVGVGGGRCCCTASAAAVSHGGL
jgi:hypothetical protein